MVLPSSQDEALARYSVSKDVPGSVLKCETVLGTLDATRKVTRLSLKESTEVPGTTSSEPFLSSDPESRVCDFGSSC